MKKITLILLGFTLLAGTACKKDKDNDSPTPSAKICMLSKEQGSDGSYSNYTYNAQNRLTASNSFDPADTSTTNLTYTYTGSQVLVSDGGLTNQTYYLNSKGYGDSALLSIAGIAEFRSVNKFNSNGEVIESFFSGEVFGTTFEIKTTYEYVNGNRVKETQDDGTDVSVITYEYYADKVNHAAKSEEAQEFMNANKNLVKKATYDDGSFDTYTYEFDADGKATKQIATNSATGVSSNQYTWTCK
jgi:hypothetical protein